MDDWLTTPQGAIRTTKTTQGVERHAFSGNICIENFFIKNKPKLKVELS